MSQVYEVEIDREGKIKLPDAVLAALGIRPGHKVIFQRVGHGEVRLHAQSTSLEVSAESSTIEIVEEDGHLFLRGVKPFEIDTLLEEEREARLNELMG